MPFFLALNLPVQTTTGRPLLGLVDDADSHLARHAWKTSADGNPFRLAHPRGSQKTFRLYLADEVRLRVFPELHFLTLLFHKNGDPLDCRAENLAYSGPKPFAPVPPGSSFSHLPEYQAALAKRQDPAEIARLTNGSKYRRGRTPTADFSQVQEFLQGVLDRPEEHRGKKLTWLNEQWAAEAFGRPMHIGTLRRILDGTQQRIEGIDYEKLADLYPNRIRKARLAAHAFTSTGGYRGQVSRALNRVLKHDNVVTS